jgi:LPS-assembly lipoprotein
MSLSENSPRTRTRRPVARIGGSLFALGRLRRSGRADFSSAFLATRPAGLVRTFFATRLASFRKTFLGMGSTGFRRTFFSLRLAGPRRAFLALGLAGFVGGCFQPLYAEHPVAVGAAGNPGVVGKLRAVDVPVIDTPAGSRLARVSVNVRNELIYDLTGGSGGFSPTHRLDVKLVATQLQVIVDINTARPDVNNYGIDSNYTLTELATGRVVVKGQTFARVSYNIPGQEQRFAGERGLRDAENRAAKEIAENIRNRLASFFVAGT